MNSVSTEWQVDEEKAAVEVLEGAIGAEERYMKAHQPKAKIHLTRHECFQTAMKRQHGNSERDHALELDDRSLETNSTPVDDTV